MPAQSKIEQLCEIARLPQTGLAVTAMVALAVLLLFGPIVPKPGLWSAPAIHPIVSPLRAQPWAGHLESTAQPPQAAETLTSASYTSGFDKEAVGLAPAPLAPFKAQPQARNPHACPDGLNCAFRTAKPVAHRPPNEVAVAGPTAAPDLGPVPPEDIPSAVIMPAGPTPKPNGLALLTSRLPSPHVLLKPFTFVADTFTGLVKKL